VVTLHAFLALAAGFGLQVGLFVHLRSASSAPGAANVVTATGAASTAAMASCCTHYLVGLLPVLGAVGLASFVDRHQAEALWFGVVSNLAGAVYLASRIASSNGGSLT